MHIANTSFAIHDDARVFIQANDDVIRRGHLTPLLKTFHAHETAAGIQVHTAFGIIPMRDEGDMHSKIFKEIKSIFHMDILPYFVNFIDG